MEKVTINKIERLKIADSKGLSSRDIKRKFGKSNDYIELHIHDLGGELLETTPNYIGYSLPDQIESNTSTLTNTLFLDPYKHLEDKGYTTGVYNVVCNVHRKKIFSGLQADFSIFEISPSRTELKLKGLGVSETKVKKAIGGFISEIEESIFNKDFILNFGNNINVLGINVAYHNQDSCALIKLYEPLPSNLEKGAEFWVVEEIIEPLEFKVDLGNSTEYETGIRLKGPNFRIDTRLNDSIPSQFKIYNDFLENTHSASLYNVMSHLSASVELSIDYTKTGTGSLETGYHFENFTHFGSAEERLKNFKYKLELLELYETQIDEINTIQGSISSSSAVTSNKNLIENKKGKLISGFDNYEKFLYYENHPYAWPKIPDFGIGNLQVTGSTIQPEDYWLQVGLTDCDVFFKPYNLRPTTSSQAVEWYGNTNELNIDYGGQILSASRFDRDNKHNLVRTIPEHISMREENEQYVTFTNMIGQYFDQIWLYIDHIGQIRNAHNSSKDGISKDLVFTALSSLGIEAFDQFENEELFEYIIGTNKTKSGSFGTYDAPAGQTMITSSLVTCDNGGSSMPKGDITKEIWKRLYHNLPYLLKTKGTERGIKALMNCYGVPETILNVKEYGGPTTDSTTYKTFNYEKFSRALAGSSDTEGYFIKAPWASSSSLFTGTIESKPNRSEGRIIFSIGAVKDLFNAPFPKTVELTATDLSVHTFTSNYDFALHGESGLETAQSLAGAIDAHTLFSASVFVREDLYDPAHEKYNLDIEIMITQHLQGIDGNTEIKGTLFEDTLTPACGNPQQFPEVEFLTKIDFNGGGGINNSTSTTTVVPGINTCSSKTLIQNGIAADGSGNLINNGLFQDDIEYMDFVTDVANGYTNIDISLFSFESLTPSAIPLYLGESQCVGVNDYGLFVIECFKADDCVNIQTIITPTTTSPGTIAVGTINIPNSWSGASTNLLTGATIILTSADGNVHTFTITGGGSVNSIGNTLVSQIDNHPDFNAVDITQGGRKGYTLEITTNNTGSNTNNPIQGSALNLSGELSPLSFTTVGLTGGTDPTGGGNIISSNSTCNAVLNFYISQTQLTFDVTATQFTDYIVQGSTGDSTYDNYLSQAIPNAQGQYAYDNNTNSYVPINSSGNFLNLNSNVYVTSTSITAAASDGYLAPSEILNYCSSNCGDVLGISDACYTNYTTFISALNNEGIINEGIPGVNVNTKWTELKAPDIITHFPASSSCGCNDFSTGNITTTTNVLTQQPTVNTSIPLGQGAQDVSYGNFGAKFYSDTTSTISYDISQTNTYFGSTNQNEGRLNNIGVWDGTVPYTGNNSITMTPLDEWIGFSKCINVPADGEYLIGLAGDNRIRFAVNGEMLIEKDTNDTGNFNYWWVYKVDLTAGNNTIVLEGKNDTHIASFGCDIVGPFPTGTFNSDADFQNIDNNGIILGGISYNDLEDAYKNNIIFTSDPGTGQLTPYVDFTMGNGNTDYWQVDSPNQMTIKNGYPQNANLRRWINSFHNLVIGCEYTINYTISNDDGVNSKGLLLFDRQQNNNWGGTTHTDGQCWITEQQGGNNCNNDTFTVTFTATDLHTSGVVDQGGVYFYSSQNQSATITINSITSTTCGGGEFNTQTNSCPEGYLYNECTGLCEKTEIITAEEVDDCNGMVINPIGNGSFTTSGDFVDYFTDFDNGFYGQNIDEYYFESDEPLPWGTFVADQCTGSNGLPIRRVVGFKKDQSILPIDTTLYVNYQTFINQLNVDEHGVDETVNFSNLTSELITGSFEGSCQHKTLITNPLSADGSFPTPGSGNTGMVDFLEYYSEQTNNIQNIAVDGFKFPIDADSFTTITQNTCNIEADIYVFYDMTSMDATSRTRAYNGFKAWHQIQVNDNGYTGQVCHIQLYGERWVLWPAWLLNPQDSSLTQDFDENNWYGTGQFSYNPNKAMSGLDNHSNSLSQIQALTEWTNDSSAILASGQIKNIPSDSSHPAYNGVDPNSNTISVIFADEISTTPNQEDQYASSGQSGNELEGGYHFNTAANNSSHVVDWYEAGDYFEGSHLDGNSVNTKKTSNPGPTPLWKIDYINSVNRIAAHNQAGTGKFNTFMYPARQNPNQAHRAFPLHVLGAIESGPTNNGTLPTAPTCNVSVLTAIESSNPYYTNTDNTHAGTPSVNHVANGKLNSGYGGLDQYGFAYNVNFITTGDASVFEAAITTDLDNFVLEQDICGETIDTIFTDPNVCLDGNGNFLFTIDEFFMDPSISTAPFSKYSDYITEGQNLGYAITLGDTRLESQIGGPIAADECICADVCPNDLVLNNNTTITITGSLFDQYNLPFTEGQTITQANNNGFSATITSLDSDSNAIVINITNGTLTFSDPLVDTGTGAQYLPDPQVGEFIIPQPQGVFTNYDEYMQFISDPINNFSSTNLNTLKFQLVEQTITEVNTQTTDCSVDADIYVFYDHTSMGSSAIATAFNAVNDWILDLEANQGFNKKVYHIKARKERWLKWGVGMLEGFSDTTKYPTGDYDVEPYLFTALADQSINVYSNTDDLAFDLTTLGPPTGDVLAVCYLDESDGVYIDRAGGGNTSDVYYPQFADFEPSDGTVPFIHNTSVNYSNFQLDYTEYVALYNNYTEGNIACFFYPTPNLDWTNATDLTGWYTQTILSGLAAITSGDNNDGLLANPPSTPNMIATPGGTAVTGHAYYTALQTSNPYFTQGYGELDKYGWGINVTFPAMSAAQLSIDLNEFVSTSNLCTTETTTVREIDILCTGSTSTDTNQYGLYTVEGFYQNSLIEVSTTTNQYAADPSFYTSWGSFLSQKIQEDGATGIDFQNNNGANINTGTTWEDLSNSVELIGSSTITTTTTPGIPINVFDQSIYNNSNLNSGVTGNPNQQLNWLINNNHGQNIDGYYFVNDTLNETQPPYNSCNGVNLPAGGGVYSTVTDFTFASLPNLTFSSAGGNYTNWHTFIDTINSLNFVIGQSIDVTTFDTSSSCAGSIDSGVSGDSAANVANSWVTWGTSAYNPPAGNFSSQNYTHTRRDHINWIATNHYDTNFNEFYFTDTCGSCPDGNCEETYRYLTKIQLVHDGLDCGAFNNYNAFNRGYFANLQVGSGFISSDYFSWKELIDALNSSCNSQGDTDHFNYSDDLETVVTTIEWVQDQAKYIYEGCPVTYYLQSNIDLCTCSTTTIPGGQVQQDIFTYTDDATHVINYLNNIEGETYNAAFTVNTSEATCNDIPGPPIETEETQSNAVYIPLYGEIDGGACVCVPETTGGESLDGDIEFESCICCPESSSISVGCLVAGEVSSSRCECSADTFETIINFVSASSFNIIPSSSAKMVEFRIKPHRLDKPEYTALEACCDPILTIPTASHLFSLFNPSQPQTTPHLVLRPHTGSDVSASDDFKDFGSLDLYKNGSVVGSTDIFPVYNGSFWNVFIGTKGESGSDSKVYFGAYQSNFLGHVTHLTASATFSEYERAASFGDTAYNLANNTLPAPTAYFCGIPNNTNSTLGDVNTFKYSGSLQEIKYHVKDFLTHDTLTKHALDPFQYAGNTVSSSWNNVYLRLPLGSNNKVDSASYNNNGLGIIQNFNPHPSFSLYESSSISSSITGQSFSEVYETHRHLTPDTVGISTTSEKVRIDSGSIDRDILSFDIRSETSTLDRQALDYNDLGVFFSPQAEINEDIVYTLGAFRMDDYIGDPTHQSLAEYPDLEELKLTYFQKYLNSYRQNMFDYIKLIQYIDHTLFKVIEQFVPAKANLKTGLLIEPHYLERQKFARQIPTFERLERDAEFDPYLILEGEVKHYEACINISDKVNENYYAWEGALTASDNLYMSQSKYASDECNPYITLYDNFDPLYGNYVDCIISKEYYYVSKPPQFTQIDPINTGINPNITINPPTPSKTSGQVINSPASYSSLRLLRTSTSPTSSGGGGYGA